MKAKILFLLLFMCLGIYSVNAQVDMMKSAEETARRLDEMDGKSTPERRANGENSSRYEYPDNNRTQEENDELREQWDEMFGGEMAAFKEGMDKFDTPETKCLFIMVIYLDTYLDIVQSTNNTDDIGTKCDGFALQSMAIAAATSIMYCPESLVNKTEEEQERIWNEDLMPIMANEDNSQLIINWKAKYKRLTGMDPRVGRENTAGLASFFHPTNIIAKLFTIQQNMESLGCSE